MCDHIHVYLFINAESEKGALKDINYLLGDLRANLKLLSPSSKYSNRGIQLNKRWTGDSYFHHVSKEFDDLNERALYLAKLDQEPRYTEKVLMFARHAKKDLKVLKDHVSVDVHASPEDEVMYLDVYVKTLHPENVPYLLSRISSKVKNSTQPHHKQLIYQSNFPEIEEYLQYLSENFLGSP